MKLRKFYVVIYLILFLTDYSYSVESYFLMLKNEKVNVRYGPSFDYPIKFIYKKKFFPVEVIDKKENFRRIIDHKRNSGWIHISQLQKSKSLVALNDTNIFKKASKFSKPVAKIKSGRLLLVKKCQDRWCKIKTGEYSGWVDSKYLWGSIK